jgi:hypothetical protein
MSSYKAVSGVSSTLRNLLKDRMTELANITIAPPDVTVSNITGRRLNLYLYHIAESGFLKNQQIPRSGNSASYGHPPLSLDLHYLFTSFGSSETGPDADLEAQQILGDAMRVLHDFSILSADLLQQKTPGNPPILDPSLIDEFEQVKVTLEPKSVDEISKIWTALQHVNFRLSVGYQVSVVQIESRATPTVGVPVRERRVYALPLASPVIQQIFRQPPLLGLPVAEAEEGETLRIIGNNLRADATRVTIDGIDVPVVAMQKQQIDITIPAGNFKTGLHTIVVVQDLKLTIVDHHPPEPRPGFRSNVVGFMLQPKLIDVQPQPSAGPGDTITVKLSPVVFDSPPTDTIGFKLPQTPEPLIPPGTYLIRLRVDGAETRLTVDPSTKRYIGPTYQVT